MAAGWQSATSRLWVFGRPGVEPPVAKMGADTISAGVTEGSTSVAATLLRTDSPTLSPGEGRLIDAVMARADNPTILVGDASSLLQAIFKTASDTVALAISEASDVVTVAVTAVHDFVWWLSTVFYGKRKR